MVELDVSDDGGLGGEQEERAIALVGFGHYEILTPEGDVAPDVVQLAPHEGSRVLAQSLEGVGDHARRSGLAVGAGNRDAAAVLQDGSQGCSARNHRDGAPTGLEELGI